MLGQQQDTLLHSGLLRDVAQSVLTEQELAMFMYLLNQYQQHGLTVNGLVTPLLNLLDTPEKVLNIHWLNCATISHAQNSKSALYPFFSCNY